MHPYISELEGFKLTKEQYRFGLAELICLEEFENPDPEMNWHEADLDDLFDGEPRVLSVQKEAEKKTDQQEMELNRRETEDSE